VSRMRSTGEARGLLAQLRDARRIVCFSHPEKDNRHFDVVGRLTAAVLADAGVPTAADSYRCGPGPFIHDIAAALTARGVPPDRGRSSGRASR
jgi:ferredoxin-NADP reductase